MSTSLDLDRSERHPLTAGRPPALGGASVSPFELDAAAPSSPSSPPTPAATTPAAVLAPYVHLLATNLPFARLYLGELLNSAGQWFSYVATLRIVNEASAKRAGSASAGAGSASAIGVVVAIHYLPSFFLSPIAGVVADRLPREDVLAAASAAGAAVAALLGVVQAELGIPFFLFLLSVQYGASAFYEISRRSISPSLVDYDEGALVIATTLDTACWSTMTAVGSAAGGLALSKLGPRWCFALDSATYVAAAAAALSLRGHIKKKGSEAATTAKAVPSRAHKAKTSFKGEFFGGGGAGRGGGESDGGSGSDREEMSEQGGRHRLVPSTDRAPAPPPAPSSPAVAPSASEMRPPPPDPSLPPTSSRHNSSLLSLATEAISAAASDAREGLRYASSNRHVLALATLKLSGTLAWGAADVMNVKLSDTPSLAVKKMTTAAATAATTATTEQEIIDPAATLGFIFSAVGAGAIVGSVAANALTLPDSRSLLRSAAAAFGLLTLGYVSLSAAAAAASLPAVLAATATRAAGSAVLWTYSTLLLQVEVPDALLGRTCALEQALYTIGECASAILAGVLFDAADGRRGERGGVGGSGGGAGGNGASVEAAAAVMAVFAGGLWAWWSAYVRWQEKRQRRQKQQQEQQQQHRPV